MVDTHINMVNMVDTSINMVDVVDIVERVDILDMVDTHTPHPIRQPNKLQYNEVRHNSVLIKYCST